MDYQLLIEAIFNRERLRPRKMSLRKHRTWGRIEDVQAEIDEVLRRLGKKETIAVAKIVELNNKHKMPTMIKHCVVAVYEDLKRRTQENRAQRFVGAHNIAFWVFRRCGLIKSSGFGMTGRGSVRNTLHERAEPGYGAARSNKYARLYNSVMKRKKSYPGNEHFKHASEPKIQSVSKG